MSVDHIDKLKSRPYLKVMILLRKLITFSALLCPIGASAHQRFEDKILTVKGYAETAGFGYNLKNPDSGAETKWLPNVRASTGIDIYIHGWFGFAIGGKGPLTTEDRVRKGDTAYDDYRLSLAYRRFYASLVYQKHTGFYIENTTTIDPTRDPNGPLIQDAQMTTENIAASFIWIFNHEEYSLEAAMDQSVRQDKSGGSWLAGLSAASERIRSPNGLVPVLVRSQYGSDATITKGDFQTLVARGGYGYTVTPYSNWFLSGYFLIGAGTEFGNYDVSGYGRYEVRPVSRAEIMASLGYNGDQFLSGIYLNIDNSTFKTASLEFSSSVTTIRFYVGTRF